MGRYEVTFTCRPNKSFVSSGTWEGICEALCDYWVASSKVFKGDGQVAQPPHFPIPHWFLLRQFPQPQLASKSPSSSVSLRNALSTVGARVCVMASYAQPHFK